MPNRKSDVATTRSENEVVQAVDACLTRQGFSRSGSKKQFTWRKGLIWTIWVSARVTEGAAHFEVWNYAPVPGLGSYLMYLVNRSKLDAIMADVQRATAGVQESAILALGEPDDPSIAPGSFADDRPSYTPPAKTSGLAIASLAAGIATWLIIPLIGAIAAVVAGHLARKRIRRDPEHLSGSGLAVAGLVLGYAHLGFALLIAITSGLALIAARSHSGGAAPATALPALAASTKPAAEMTIWTPTVPQPRQVHAVESEDTEQSQIPAPRAGHWEGEPSVSFDVTRNGQVHNLEITVPFGLSTCTVTMGETFIGQQNEITMGEPTGEPLAGTFKATLFITGQFTGETILAGTYRIGICHTTGDKYTAIAPPHEGAWNAEWKSASDPSASTTGPTPTSSPVAIATPAPTPTAVAAPVSLAGALAQNLADIRIRGTGGASGSSILLLVRTAAGQKPGTIKVEPGTVLRSYLAGEQDMVVRRLLGWRVDEHHYNPAETIFLTGIEGTQTYVADAYCLNFHKDNPSAGNSFTLDGMAEPPISAILQAVDRMPGMDAEIAAIQAAIWAMTDNPTWAELAERGYSPDHERVRSLLQEAGLDPICTALFGGQCAQTPQASRQGTEPAPGEAAPEPRKTTTVLDAQVKKFFAPGPDSAAIAVAGDDIWVADGKQRRIHQLDRNGAPLGSFPVKAEGEFRGLTWDAEALRLLVQDYRLGSQVIRLDTQGNELSRFTVPADLSGLAWNPVDKSFWTIASQSDGFLLELDAGGGLRQTLNVSVFGNPEAVAWAPDGLWVLSVFGKWHRFGFAGDYLASAELPMKVFAQSPALAWDPAGYLWVSVADAREIYQFSLRQAAIDAELPPELRSGSQARAEGQLPLPRPAFSALPGNTNAVVHVANGLPAPLSVALDSLNSGDVHESAVVAPGTTWSVVSAKGGAFTLFLNANAAEPVAYSDKIFLLPGYEYTWAVGNAVAANPGAQAGHGIDTATPMPTATETPSSTATSSPPAVTAAPTLSPTRAAPTRVPTRPKPTAAPAATCADPRVRITYPANGATVSGVTNFIGTANLPDQVYYKFEYKPASSPTWQFLTQFDDKAVVNDKLMDFFTTTIAPGVYDFRLIAVDRSGNYPPPCEIRVTVQR